MTILSTLFYIVMGGSLIFCVLNIVTAMLRKKTFKMLLNFLWLILLVVTGITTWLYFQGFLYGNYYGWLPEFDHLMFGIQEGNTLAKISLYSNIVSFVLLVMYVIILINRMIRGVNNAVEKTADSISNTIDGAREKKEERRAAREEKRLEKEAAKLERKEKKDSGNEEMKLVQDAPYYTAREEEEPIELKLDDRLSELAKEAEEEK